MPPASATAPTSPAASPQGHKGQIRVEIPKKIAVTADPGGRGRVILIINHQLENQIGYALTPDAAGNIADGLTKSAAAVRLARPAGPAMK